MIRFLKIFLEKRRIVPVLLLVLFLLAIISWIGSTWGWGMRNLVSADGIRWFVSNFIINIKESPVGVMFLTLLAIGAVNKSGMLVMFSRKWSLKQKRAFSITLLVAVLIVLLVLGLTFVGDGVLLSPFGSVENSPLLEGLIWIILVSLILLANIFGYTSGRFMTLADMLKADTSMICSGRYDFVVYIMVAEICGCISFTGLLPNSIWGNFAQLFLYLLPFC